ncbi:hypothetical protein IAU60_004427 [Kwoniella sp. DSM 27419]
MSRSKTMPSDEEGSVPPHDKRTSGAQEYQDNRPDRPSDYFNYHPPFLVLKLALSAWVCLAIVVFGTPSGGLSAVVKDGSEYVGVLRSCTGTNCDAWLTAAQSPATPTTSSRSEREVTRRDLGASADLPAFYLRAGMATLSAFWLMTYTTIFLLTRYFSSIPPHSAEAEERGPRTKVRGIRDGFKRFAWRISRMFMFFLTFIVLGIACDASYLAFQAGGVELIGIGTIVLHLTWVQLAICTYLELSRSRIRRKIDLTWWGCVCLKVPSHRRRAVEKWRAADRRAKLWVEEQPSTSESPWEPRRQKAGSRS